MPDLKGSFRKTKDFFGFNVSSLELARQRDGEAIEKMDNHTAEFGLEFPVGLLGCEPQPMSTIITQTTLSRWRS